MVERMNYNRFALKILVTTAEMSLIKAGKYSPQRSITFYNHFSLKSAFITAGARLLKSVQPYSSAMHRPLNRIFNQIVLSRFHYSIICITIPQYK